MSGQENKEVSGVIQDSGFIGKIKSYIKFVSEHITIILLIPTLLGGLWQVVSLGTTSISYIRFFSISQLLSDGIILMIWLCLWGMFIYIGYRFFKKNDNQEKIEQSSEKTRGERIATTIGYLGLCGGIVLFLIKLDRFMYHDLDFVKVVMIPIIIAIVITFMLFFSSALMAIFNLKAEDIHASKLLKFSTSVLSILTTLYVLYAFFNVLSNFNKAFVLPQNIENAHNLLESMKEEDSTCIYRIAYLNDLYVFVNVERKEDTTVQAVKIIKTDVFFETKSYREAGDVAKFKVQLDSMRAKWKQMDSITDVKVEAYIKSLDSVRK
ncbi:hypothetical protein AMR72_08640 [Flavobacterium psychrophilum]|nr:hypothetical protein AMR72_08640 [Flavobacterium psychrophilum]AOE52565.1 hypothetical protein ALW18_08630 [Flavobacterium psychrophilum]